MKKRVEFVLFCPNKNICLIQIAINFNSKFISNALFNQKTLESREEEFFHILLIGQLLQVEGDFQSQVHILIQFGRVGIGSLVLLVFFVRALIRLLKLIIEDFLDVLMRYPLLLLYLPLEYGLHAFLHLFHQVKLVVNTIYTFLALPVHLRHIEVRFVVEPDEIIADLPLEFASELKFPNKIRLLNTVLEFRVLVLNLFNTKCFRQQCKPQTLTEILSLFRGFMIIANSPHNALLDLFINLLLASDRFLLGLLDLHLFTELLCLFIILTQVFKTFKLRYLLELL